MAYLLSPAHAELFFPAGFITQLRRNASRLPMAAAEEMLIASRRPPPVFKDVVEVCTPVTSY